MEVSTRNLNLEERNLHKLKKLIVELQTRMNAASENDNITTEELVAIKWKLCDTNWKEELFWK